MVTGDREGDAFLIIACGESPNGPLLIGEIILLTRNNLRWVAVVGASSRSPGASFAKPPSSPGHPTQK